MCARVRICVRSTVCTRVSYLCVPAGACVCVFGVSVRYVSSEHVRVCMCVLSKVLLKEGQLPDSQFLRVGADLASLCPTALFEVGHCLPKLQFRRVRERKS